MMNIVLIKNCNVLRNAYKQIIDNSSHYNVVGDFENYELAIEKLEVLKPDAIIMNMAKPYSNGILRIKQIKRRIPTTKIIIISADKNAPYVFDALQAGAIGFLIKSTFMKEILSALKQLAMGGAPMSASISRLVVASFQEKKFEELTDRENDVLTILSQGKSYANIGKELFLSKNTIKSHVRNIYEKLHVSSRDEVISLVNSNYPTQYTRAI